MAKKEKSKLAKKFSKARASAGGGLLLGKDFSEALSRGPRYLPKLACLFVKNDDDPEHGFADRADAIEAARKYRNGCREWLAKNSPNTNR